LRWLARSRSTPETRRSWRRLPAARRPRRRARPRQRRQQQAARS